MCVWGGWGASAATTDFAGRAEHCEIVFRNGFWSHADARALSLTTQTSREGSTNKEVVSQMDDEHCFLVSSSMVSKWLLDPTNDANFEAELQD